MTFALILPEKFGKNLFQNFPVTSIWAIQRMLATNLKNVMTQNTVFKKVWTSEFLL